MKEISKTITTMEDGEETVVIGSNDKYTLHLNNNYKLANHILKKEGIIVKKLKNSVLGNEVGMSSRGFTSIAILAVVIAVAAFAIMFFMWRF